MHAVRQSAMSAPLAVGLLAACTAVAPPVEPPSAGFTIVAINDVYRIEGADGGAAGGPARVRALRARLEAGGEAVLMLHAGDLLYPSLLSRRYRGAQMIDILNLLDGDDAAFDGRMFATFGNHEFDRARLADAAGFAERLTESQFTWLGTNLRFASDEAGRPLVAAPNLRDSALVTVGGVRVGLFSLTTDDKVPEFVECVLRPPRVAREATAELRARGAQVVIGLTHLSVAQDLALLEALGADGPDLVIGGHEHEAQAASRGGRWMLKADAEARSATVARVTPVPGSPPRVEHRAVPLAGDSPPPDPVVQARSDGWLERHAREFCASAGEPAGCLEQPLGVTRVRLEGEELTIRRFESNLGNWVADQMLAAFADQGAQAAFINAGTLRLNQDLPPGSVTRRHVEELLAYPAQLMLLRLDAGTLRAVMARSVEGWTGNGWWLQIAGLAFRHDPDSYTASDLTLLAPGGPRPLADGEELLVVTQGFLVDPENGQDGYTMLSPDQVVATGEDLEQVVVAALAAAGDDGIAPRVEGRICNPSRPGPCLAVSP